MSRLGVGIFAALLVPAVVRAEEPVHARQEFVRGVELAKRAEWAEARRAFESSLAERPHPVTRYNLALCDRALGEVVRAVHELDTALSITGPDALSGETLREAVRLRVELMPQRAFVDVLRGDADTIRVDGFPLERLGGEFTSARALDAVAVLPVGPVHIALDRGEHILQVTREGHTPAELRVLLQAGETRSFAPRLSLRPGSLFVTATPAHARARVDGGLPAALPLRLTVPAGSHRVDVELTGHQPFSTRIWIRPDVRSNVHAELTKKHVSILGRWWFWTAIGTGLVAAGAITYAVTRPESSPDGGSLGWVVRP